MKKPHEKEFRQYMLRVGAYIKNERLARGITQERLAEDASVPKGNLSKVERGANSTLNTLWRLAKALGLDVKDLL